MNILKSNKVNKPSRMHTEGTLSKLGFSKAMISAIIFAMNKEEILSHLAQDQSNSAKFYLIEPHLLYTSDEQAKGYLKVMKSPQYTSGFHDPTVETIIQNLENLFGNHSKKLSFIDLGPGYPDKALPIAKYFKKQGTPFDYYPIDVSREFLRVSEQAMHDQASLVKPIQSLFEECGQFIPNKIYQGSVMSCIGLTFMNFDSKFILKLLKDISGKEGSILIASELITKDKPIKKILHQYDNQETLDFTFGLLKKLEISPNMVKFTPKFENQRVEMTYEFLQSPPLELQHFGIKQGSQLVVAISYRYHLEDLKKILSENLSQFKVFLSQDKGTAISVGK